MSSQARNISISTSLLPPLIPLPPSSVSSNHTPFSYSNRASSLLPQGLWTCCSLFLEHSSPVLCMHGLQLLIHQVLGKRSFPQRLSLTTLIFLLHHSPNTYSCFIFSLALITICWLILFSTRIKNTILQLPCLSCSQLYSNAQNNL